MLRLQVSPVGGDLEGASNNQHTKLFTLIIMVMMTFQYMVDFTMPEVLSEDFIAQIPQQRTMINKYFQEGKLLNYALSLETSKVWAVFRAETQREVLEWIADMPLTEYMDIEISNLTFFNAMQPRVPEFSLN